MPSNQNSDGVTQIMADQREGLWFDMRAKLVWILFFSSNFGIFLSYPQHENYIPLAFIFCYDFFCKKQKIVMDCL
jgi:hypothetical protein